MGEHGPTDPSSGDSAGGDITSSLTAASMACRGISSSSCGAPARGKLGERRRAHYGVAMADESGAMRGGDGAEGDGGWADIGEAAIIGADGLAEVALKEGQREEAAIRLYLHLPGEAGRRRIGLRRHLKAKSVLPGWFPLLAAQQHGASSDGGFCAPAQSMHWRRRLRDWGLGQDVKGISGGKAVGGPVIVGCFYGHGPHDASGGLAGQPMIISWINQARNPKLVNSPGIC